MKLTLLVVGIAMCLAAAPTTHASPDKHPTCQELLADDGITALVLLNMQQIHHFPGQYALAANQLMVQIIEYYGTPNLDYAYLELLFRKHEFPIYLIAKSTPPPYGFRVGYPNGLLEIKKDIPAKYWLWVGVNGKAEADAEKRAMGVSDEENIRRLSETGVMITNESDTSSMSVSSVIKAHQKVWPDDPRATHFYNVDALGKVMAEHDLRKTMAAWLAIPWKDGRAANVTFRFLESLGDLRLKAGKDAGLEPLIAYLDTVLAVIAGTQNIRIETNADLALMEMSNGYFQLDEGINEERFQDYLKFMVEVLSPRVKKVHELVKRQAP